MVPVAVQAAKRWGLQNPSMDDVITESLPRYDRCPSCGGNVRERAARACWSCSADLFLYREEWRNRWSDLIAEAMEYVVPEAHGMCPICESRPIPRRDQQTCGTRECVHEVYRRRRVPPKALTADQKDHARRLREDGASVATVAEEVGLTIYRTRKLLAELGVML